MSLNYLPFNSYTLTYKLAVLTKLEFTFVSTLRVATNHKNPGVWNFYHLKYDISLIFRKNPWKIDLSIVRIFCLKRLCLYRSLKVNRSYKNLFSHSYKTHSVPCHHSNMQKTKLHGKFVYIICYGFW